MQIFTNSAFSATALSGYVQKVPFVPQLLGSLNIFEPVPVRSRNIMVDRRENGLQLIPVSPDGAPPTELASDMRDAVTLQTVSLAKGFTLYAHELTGIRQEGTDAELKAVQVEYDRRTRRIRADLEATHEYHRLGALQGLVLDADGVTVIADYSTIFNALIPPVVSFDLGNANSNVQKTCKDIARSMARAGGGTLAGANIHAIAGDEFYDELVSHPSVEKFYLNQSAASDAREAQGRIFDSFRVGGITFHNYQGTDDNSTVAVPTDEAKFFPVGAQEVFKVAYSPLATNDFVNTPGQPIYMMNVMDRDRNMWSRGEIYSNALHICQRPDVLARATAN